MVFISGLLPVSVSVSHLSLSPSCYICLRGPSLVAPHPDHLCCSQHHHNARTTSNAHRPIQIKSFATYPPHMLPSLVFSHFLARPAVPGRVRKALRLLDPDSLRFLPLHSRRSLAVPARATQAASYAITHHNVVIRSRLCILYIRRLHTRARSISSLTQTPNV